MKNLQMLIDDLKSADEEKRRLAVVGLRDHPLEQMLDTLLIALGDVSWRVRKEAVDIIVAAASGADSDQLKEELVNMLRSQDNAGLRNSAVESLERLGRQATGVLCRHVQDPDHDVRKFVVDIMGNIADPAFVPALLDALDDSDANVRAAAAENLGKIKDVRSLYPLLERLTKSEVLLKFTILEAIGKLGQPIPLENIIPLVNDNLLKKAVFDCLGAVGDQGAVPFLVDGLKDKLKKAREAAAVALLSLRRRLGSDSANALIDQQLRQLAGTPFLEGLIDSFNNSETNVKEALASVLSVIGDERAATPLLNSCDDSLRRYCVQAFRNMGPNVAASLLEAFPHADDQQRCFIIYLCGELGYKECIPLLTEGMLDMDPELRKISVQAAGKTGLTVFTNEISHLLEDPEPDVRTCAMEALYRLAEKDSVAVAKIAGKLASSEQTEKRRNAAVLCAALSDTEKLSLLVKDEDASVRQAAISSLAELKSTACTNPIVMALVDEDPDVRIAAAGALGAMGGDEVVDPLLLALKDDDQWVQCAVLKSLGRLRNDKVLPAIIELFDHAGGLVLITALNVVADIGGEQAMSLVEKALDNPDEDVVKAAIGILSAQQSGEWIHKYCNTLLHHFHWDVRSTFIKAMVSKLGEEAFPLLRQALHTETDELVKGQIIELMDRVL